MSTFRAEGPSVGSTFVRKSLSSSYFIATTTLGEHRWPGATARTSRRVNFRTSIPSTLANHLLSVYTGVASTSGLTNTLSLTTWFGCEDGFGTQPVIDSSEKATASKLPDLSTTQAMSFLTPSS